MKKLLSTSIAIICICMSFNTAALAQESPIKLGAGLVFGTGAFNGGELDNDIGLRAEGFYTINEKFRANADFTFFFPKKEGELKATIVAINLNGNYIFYSEDQLTAYGLAGLNIAILSVDLPEVDIPEGIPGGGGSVGGSNSDTEIGLNIGGGVEYALDFANLYGELKYAGLGGNADELVISAGLRFSL